jgi:hypothetical protein
MATEYRLTGGTIGDAGSVARPPSDRVWTRSIAAAMDVERRGANHRRVGRVLEMTHDRMIQIATAAR